MTEESRQVRLGVGDVMDLIVDHVADAKERCEPWDAEELAEAIFALFCGNGLTYHWHDYVDGRCIQCGERRAM